MKTLILIFLLFLVMGCSKKDTLTNSLSVKNLNNENPTTVNNQESSTLSEYPQEYQRLTIPYLRQQNFPGSQIQVGQQVSNTSNYTSYLASYQSEDLTVNGLLTIPKGTKPEGGWPAVVFIHGYIPPNEYRTTQKYEAYVNALAQAGLVVFKIDLRGHGSSEGEPTGAYFSGDYIYDVLNAYASLEKLDYVDPDKIGLWGHSMAGNLVARSMVVRPNIPTGVIWAGAVYSYEDMRAYSIQDSSYQPSQNPNRGKRDELYQTVGEVSLDNQFWKAVTPVTYLSDLQGRIDIHHATNDPVVNIGYSRDLNRYLQEADVKHSLYEYNSGGHNIESPAFTQAMQRTIEVFKQM